DPEYLRKLDEPNRSELRFAEAQAQVARDERDRFAKLVEVGEVDLRRELASATAAVAVAEARVRELEKPRDHHAIVEYATSHARVLRTEVELATGRRDDAARALADARRALDACRVYATASGVIDEVLVTPGRVVSRDEPVARMSTWTEAPAPDAR
ncbi:MAG TPA: hypothetical protein VLX92_13230, partial [Kofleriaceae bacterium]|nr:hypothetical protein [Kofleriaceae bacterium]